MKVHLDQADPGHRPRFDVIDAAAQREKTLKGIRDVGFNLLWRHAGIKRRHYYHWNLHRWK